MSVYWIAHAKHLYDVKNLTLNAIFSIRNEFLYNLNIDARIIHYKRVVLPYRAQFFTNTPFLSNRGSKTMATGTVKWFNNAKGYGFVVEDNGQDDLFAHFSSIQMGGYKTLKAGQTVEFDTVKADKGFHAVNIRAVGADVLTVNNSSPGSSSSPETDKILESTTNSVAQPSIEHV